jgi:hypothetical protein
VQEGCQPARFPGSYRPVFEIVLVEGVAGSMPAALYSAASSLSEPMVSAHTGDDR